MSYTTKKKKEGNCSLLITCNLHNTYTRAREKEQRIQCPSTNVLFYSNGTSQNTSELHLIVTETQTSSRLGNPKSQS